MCIRDSFLSGRELLFSSGRRSRPQRKQGCWCPARLSPLILVKLIARPAASTGDGLPAQSAEKGLTCGDSRVGRLVDRRDLCDGLSVAGHDVTAVSYTHLLGFDKASSHASSGPRHSVGSDRRLGLPMLALVPANRDLTVTVCVSQRWNGRGLRRVVQPFGSPRSTMRNRCCTAPSGASRIAVARGRGATGCTSPRGRY